MLRDYNTWRAQGLIQHSMISGLGFPSTTLSVTDAGTTYTGQAALTQISNIVLAQGAIDAYKNGKIAPLVTPAPGPAITVAP